MASFSNIARISLLVILGLAYGVQSTDRRPILTFARGIEVQTRLFTVGEYNKILPNGTQVTRPIIPVEEALGCSNCGSLIDCERNCENFNRLLHSITELHEERQKLMAIRDQNSDDQEIEVLNIILDRLSTQACTLLTTKLDNFDCTYSELMKIKAKLELFFAIKRISNVLRTSTYDISGPYTSEQWVNDLVCNISDPQLLSVIRSAYGGASCTQQ